MRIDFDGSKYRLDFSELINAGVSEIASTRNKRMLVSSTIVALRSVTPRHSLALHTFCHCV